MPAPGNPIKPTNDEFNEHAEAAAWNKFQAEKPGMIAKILGKLYVARESATVGKTSVTVDGIQTIYQSPQQLDQAIQFWERKLAFATGRRRRAMAIRLDNF